MAEFRGEWRGRLADKVKTPRGPRMARPDRRPPAGRRQAAECAGSGVAAGRSSNRVAARRAEAGRESWRKLKECGMPGLLSGQADPPSALISRARAARVISSARRLHPSAVFSAVASTSRSRYWRATLSFFGLDTAVCDLYRRLPGRRRNRYCVAGRDSSRGPTVQCASTQRHSLARPWQRAGRAYPDRNRFPRVPRILALR